MKLTSVEGPSIRVGIDIGGTFTDLVVLADGELTSVKVDSTPADFGEGFARALAESGVTGRSIDSIVHATTVATNALLERKGALCGLLTTQGFRDILALRRGDRRRPAGIEKAFEPLIPRHLRLEVEERSEATGNVQAPDEEEAAAAVLQLWDAGAEVVVVSFLHAAEHSRHERETAALLRDRFPGRSVIAATEVCEEPREFERTATASAAAYVTPLMERYVTSLEARLSGMECLADFQIVASDGGLIPASVAPTQALRTALSGPAAGVWGMGELCASLAIPNFVATDMGGTSFDVCLVADGTPGLTRSRAIDFGIPLAIPCMDITTIGAGGGSIARVDEWGSLEVGPDGTGADPGPVCYGKQSHDPTVTDADLVLGRVGSRLRLPSGQRGLDADAASQALQSRIGHPLGVSSEDAATFVLEALHEKASEAIRVLAMEKLVSLDDVVLAAYGGAGPLHAADLARHLGIARVIVPPRAGVFSAVGGLMVARREVRWRRLEVGVDPQGIAALEQAQDDLARQATEALGTPPAVLACEVEVAYEGQPTGIEILLPQSPLTESIVRNTFDARYGIYGTPLDMPLAVRSVRVTAVSGECQTTQVLDAIRPRGGNGEPTSTRAVRFGEILADCPVYDREEMKVDSEVTGPAVIEEAGATTLLPPGSVARMDAVGVLYVDIEADVASSLGAPAAGPETERADARTGRGRTLQAGRSS